MGLTRLDALVVLAAQATCGAVFIRHVGARPADEVTIIHDEGRMECSGSVDGPRIDWSASSAATAEY
jgi:hypothetical protein